jgi:energy-coupling factor transporter ATP-binding protein EcfA2
MSSPDTEKQSRAVALIELITRHCSLHQDQNGTPFVWLKNPGRTMLVNSREFKAFAVKEFYQEYTEVVGSEALNAAINVLMAEAYESEKVPLQVRIARGPDDTILIDPCNRSDDNSAIKVSWGKVEMIQVNRPLFRRYSHMKPFSIGEERDFKDFLAYFKLKDSEKDLILLAGFIGAALVPDIPHAILVLMGPQGSAKTTLTRALANLVDPSSTDVLSVPTRQDELAQQLAHRYTVPYDNVSRLSISVIDTFCRATSGQAFTKRALYTDEDDVIFSFRRVLILNGTNVPSKRGDLLDRALLLELSRVPEAERKEEQEVWKEIEKKLPGVRAAVLNSLARAMLLVDQVRSDLKKLPRMADFAVWAEAFCRALGYPNGAFYEAYMQRLDETTKVALENDVVAELILKLFSEYKQYLKKADDGVMFWEGTAAELLKLLNEVNRLAGYVDEKELPRSPETLGRWLNDLAANLGDEGIKVQRRKEGKQRTRKITIMNEASADPGQGSGPRTVRKEPSAPSALSANHYETEPDPADSKADSNIEASARQPSAKTDDMKQDRRTADRADSTLRTVPDPSAASSKPDQADALPREPDKAQYPQVTEQTRPQHCPHPELCGYYGVFLYPNDLEEHLQKLHGGVSQ